MAIIINGKEIAEEIKSEIRDEVELLNVRDIYPRLAVIIAGNDPASMIYVRDKKRACEQTDILSSIYEIPEDVLEEELLSLIARLNADMDVSGILVQLPLPAHIDTFKVQRAIDPMKDVDCFHPENAGLLSIGKPAFLPCTPAGVIELIKRSGVEISGKNCVVIGRSNIVGKPMAQMLLAENGTVTICHSRTQNLADICKGADILVAAMRSPRFIKADMVKEGAVVIDVGIHRIDGKLCGDVDFDGVKEKASYITPVPGGVGPMTIAMLMRNCLYAAKEAGV